MTSPTSHLDVLRPPMRTGHNSKVPLRPTSEIRGPRITGFHILSGAKMVGAVSISTII